MNRRIVLGISAVTTWTCFLAGLAVAQKKTLKEQLIGSWLIVTADTPMVADSNRLVRIQKA